MNRCAGAFGHTGPGVWFSPSGSPEAASQHTYTVALDDQVPIKRVDDSKVYWVYPGTELRFDFTEPWNVEERGAFSVTSDVYLAGIQKASQAPKVVVNGRTIDIEKPKGQRKRKLIAINDMEAPKGPWSIVYSSPEDGPFMVVQTLWLGEGDKGDAVVNLSRSQPR